MIPLLLGDVQKRAWPSTKYRKLACTSRARTLRPSGKVMRWFDVLVTCVYMDGRGEREREEEYSQNIYRSYLSGIIAPYNV